MMKKRVTYVDNDGFEHDFEPLNDEVEIVKKGKHFYAFYLVQDESPSSPNEWGNEDAFIVNYHQLFWVEKNSIITEGEIKDWYLGNKIPQEEVYEIFKLSAHIHSGVWLSLQKNFSCDPGGWDTSHVGAVLVSKKQWGDHEKRVEVAQAIVDEWNMYLSGDVYGIVQEKFDNKKRILDCESCWGFYGHENAKAELQGQKESTINGEG